MLDCDKFTPSEDIFTTVIPEEAAKGLVAEAASVTVKVMLVPAATVVGVPVIKPLGDIDKPAGRLPAVTAQVYGAVPPVATS
jgi:hypothetical protein